MIFPKLKIDRISSHKGTRPAFPSENILFSVQHSSGKLHMVWYKPEENAEDYFSALLLGDAPLLRIQSSGSPTCESLLAAGYGLPEDNSDLRSVKAALSQPYAGLDDALERLQPFLGLLQPGVYILTYSLYYPTDGDGRFFWDVPEDFTAYKATAQYYDAVTYRVLPSFPCYLYPTQGTNKFDPLRVSYYRQRMQMDKAIPPILAYSIWGYMSALLDGHHRACACALEGTRIPCLTISSPGRIWREGVPHLIWPDEYETPIDGILTPAQQKLLMARGGPAQSRAVPSNSLTMRLNRTWPKEYQLAARRYPTCYDAGALALYPGVALNAEGLRLLAMDDDYEDVSSAARLLRYAARQPDANVKALGMGFTEVGYPTELRRAAFEILNHIKGDTEIDELMIDVLVNCERKDDPIYQIANSHWD